MSDTIPISDGIINKTKMEQVATRLGKTVRKKAEEYSKSKGITLSEYIRFLVLKDLEDKNLLSIGIKDK